MQNGLSVMFAIIFFLFFMLARILNILWCNDINV